MTLFMCAIGAWLFTGEKLTRYIVFVVLWQLFTTILVWYQDIPLLLISFGAVEFVYARLARVIAMYQKAR